MNTESPQPKSNKRLLRTTIGAPENKKGGFYDPISFNQI